MDDESVTDLILRAVAAMRERGELPEITTPRITIVHVLNASETAFRSDVGQALSIAQTGEQPRLSPHALASAVADYLREVVDLVPAYHDVATVTTDDDGLLVITMRDVEAR